MAYNELVKNLSHIRGFLRDFYIFGFKSRDDYNEKSSRAYDDEKRRLESWLGKYMGFRRKAGSKCSFISIDSRMVRHNPLYRVWKTKSFTSGDITLHFILFDILTHTSEPLDLSEIIDNVCSNYLNKFDEPMLFDESTIRKKLKEYELEGFVNISKDGKKSKYSLNISGNIDISKEFLDFYSEVAPCGVVGSYFLDKETSDIDHFIFKHHYITSSIDSEIMCDLFEILIQSCFAEIVTIGGKEKISKAIKLVPIQIFISVQNGRQYLMAWNLESKKFKSYRVDYIFSVKALEKCENVNELHEKLETEKQYMWGVLGQKGEERPKHIEFVVHAEDNETYIYKRLLREKRCGNIEIIDKNTYRFSAEVYDLGEMIPWIRTFISRISNLKTDDDKFNEKFKNDLSKMYSLYGIGGGDDVI